MKLFGLGEVKPGLGTTLWPQVGVAVQGCEPDNRFASIDPRCVALTGNIDDALHIAFPKSYYVWCQEHLWWRLQNKPGKYASDTERVVWCLDVWATAQFGLMAINMHMGPPTPRSFGFDKSGGVGMSSDAKWLQQFANGDPALEGVWHGNVRYYSQMRMLRDQGIEANKRAPMNDAIRERIARAPLRPAPFATMVPWWFGVPTRFQDVSEGYDNTLPMSVHLTCIPWMVGGFNVRSKDNKDAPLFEKYRGNDVMLTALRQWRLWSLRELFPWDRDAGFRKKYDAPKLNVSVFPRFMGTCKDTVDLDTYISRVSTEPRNKYIVGTEQGWFPTLQSAIDSRLPGIAGVVIGTEYDRAIRTRLESWMERVKPPLDENGRVLTGEGGRPYRVGVTCEDFNDIVDENQKRLEARLHAEISKIGEDNPDSCKDAADDGPYVQETCQRLQEFNAKFIAKIPVISQIIGIVKFLMHGLVAQFGAAVVGGGPPFFVLPQPFVRVVNDNRFSTAIRGSTATALAYVTNAMMWIQNTLDIWMLPFTPDPHPKLQQTQECERALPDKNGVVRCVTNVPADCAAIVWDENGKAICLSSDTPEEFRKRMGQQPPDCSAIVTGLSVKYDASLTRAARLHAVALCQQEVDGEAEAGAAERYVKLAKDVGRVPSFEKKKGIPWLLVAAAAAGLVVLKRRRK